MNRIPIYLAGLIIGLFLISAVHSQDANLTLTAAGLKEAGAPRLIGESILLSYKFRGQIRLGQIHAVQAAFDHEAYSPIHPFSLNDAGVFVLIIAAPRELSVLRYRLVVDGIWTTDPNATSEVADRWGVRISEFDVPSFRPRNLDLPAVTPEGLVEFQLFAGSGKSVSIVGSFNGWDPYMTPMIETQPGTYSRVIRLTQGEHFYYFVVDGVRLPDPNNSARRWNVDGMAVSVVELP